ncbi:MAG: type I 3-dehydroquinate dehydratase [Thermodesulfovibrionales bacterium]|nr:type I 3-dehydroquinate dehydratase [Thermodesulfovibrionales bacterium]
MHNKTPLIACVLTDDDVRTINEKVLEADLVELRVDMFSNPSEEAVKDTFLLAKEKFRRPIIGTIRDVSEGGQVEFSDRFFLYKSIASLADLIDVEISSELLLKKIQTIINDKIILIGSYHNFNTTPPDDFLEGMFIKAKEMGFHIIKIAVHAENKDDLIRLLLFTFRHRDDRDIGLITISMGEEGKYSRIIFPLFGSLITYGYINRPSAPGQLSVTQLSELFRLFNIR